MPAARFTKAEITRAVEAAKACDLTVSGVEIAPDGTIKICCAVDASPETRQDKGTPIQWGT